MPIDFRKNDPQGILRYTVLRKWVFDGHEVVLTTVENAMVDYECKSVHLMCECDVDKDRSVKAHKCPAKQRVRDEVAAESWQKYGAGWQAMTVDDAVLDVYARFRNKEYLGQYHADSLYAQDVARLLKKDLRDILGACARLFAAEKLNLNGMVLIDYEPRFRFPKEIQMVFRYMIEEPLGWPNGEAGDGVVAALEMAIHENTDYKHGKQAFWEHNYPNIEPHLLIMFGAEWLERGLDRLAADPAAKAEFLKWYKPSATVKDLRRLARRFAQLGKGEKKAP